MKNTLDVSNGAMSESGSVIPFGIQTFDNPEVQEEIWPNLILDSYNQCVDLIFFPLSKIEFTVIDFLIYLLGISLIYNWCNYIFCHWNSQNKLKSWLPTVMAWIVILVVVFISGSPSWHIVVFFLASFIAFYIFEKALPSDNKKLLLASILICIFVIVPIAWKFYMDVKVQSYSRSDCYKYFPKISGDFKLQYKSDRGVTKIKTSSVNP
jgi:hypothetical protein